MVYGTIVVPICVIFIGWQGGVGNVGVSHSVPIYVILSGWQGGVVYAGDSHSCAHLCHISWLAEWCR